MRACVPPATAWSAGHRGGDLAAPGGQVVRSPAPGSVTFAGSVAGKPVVVVAHPHGLRSTFEPAVATVPTGTHVAAGETVARLDADASRGTAGHCAAQGCLHWGVLRGDVYLDPLTLLGAGEPIVLLPAHG
jgi:murein DD-endopeptidase MepM/ murein hydrolase activator NlpD